MSNARQQTKLALNEALRTCDAIIAQIESRPDWEAYNRAVKAQHTKPWLFL